ncbi:uncharacterized protein LOC113467739 isoform X2 [Diaphorina citri]|uniref:Uncharacterized protein LOC113467739 isoform X2 n=1 Tax=Diaphorina citri TaxID=121845 RepID=A0A3Q0IUG0_DIACI|nr:uncharacterized protein LOC113467739 isoform X2 [Diaphorina citri]
MQENDVIILSETWLKSDINDAELLDDNYQIFRRDRDETTTSKGRGGGLLIAVRNHLEAYMIEDWTVCEAAYECLWVKMKLPYYLGTLLICCVYLPPPVSALNMELFSTYLESLSENLHHNSFMLVGDFNCSNFCESMNCPSDNVMRTLCNLISLFNLTSGNNTVYNERNKILDLVLYKFLRNTNESTASKRGIACNVSKGTSLLKEDKHHPTLSIKIQWDKMKKPNKERQQTFKLNAANSENIDHIENLNPLVNELFLKYRFNYNTANYELLSDEIKNTDWSNILSSENPTEALELLYRSLYILLNRHVKVYRNENLQNNVKKFPFWWEHETHKLYKEKEWYRKKKHLNDFYKVQYERLRQCTKEKISADYKNHFSVIESKIKEDSSYFWDFFKKRKSEPKRTVYECHGEILTDPTKIANAFANYYSTVYNNDRSTYLVNFPENDRTDELNIDEITLDEVIAAIAKLKRNKGPGIDNIPASIIIDAKQWLAVPLQHIFNLSLENKLFPNLLKCTLIRPVPKKENSKQVTDTRPIAKLNSFAKIFEIILYEKMSTHIFPKISPHQHGFINNRSTSSNLLKFQTYCTEAIENKSKQIDVFYGDIFKAYDQCHHDTLLSKLYDVGLSRSLVEFLASYLDRREHRVQHEKALSEPFYPPSSIPQGSKLSGLKFIVMINGIQQVIKHSQFELYADDIKLYKTINSLE